MERISVAIRVRPSSREELVKGNHWVVEEEERKLSLCNCYGAPLSGYTYAFDQLFGPNSKNSEVYDIHAKEVVLSALRGFNGTVFAYGQTSSGKTYTMQGSESQPGIIPLAIRDVFDIISQNSSREFLVRVSYMEIYNEEINDLLAPENRKLQIHENFERGLFVAGLREEIVNSPDQVFDFLKLGEAHRHFGETNMNSYSSRSHTIFRMVIESRDNNRNTDSVRVSTLNLVDLAGSERVAKTGAGGVRLKEGTHINKSLMTLGTVINKLSEGPGKGGHVPYRDSKLTRILQSALDGNAKTAIICTITPDEIHIDETRGTLQFASRAKKVATHAHVNEILTDAALLKRQKKEIEELREKLLGLQSDDFEKQLLNLRNDLLKYELEKEKLALELEEERRAQLDRDRRIKEQEQKIQNLSSLILTSAQEDQLNTSRTSSRRETWSPHQVMFDGSAKDCFRSPLARLDNSLISTRRKRNRAVTPLPAFESLLEKNVEGFWDVESTPARAEPKQSEDQDLQLHDQPNVADEDTWTRLNQEGDEDSTALNTENQTSTSTLEYTPCVKSNKTDLMEFELKELQLQFEELHSRFEAKNEEAEDTNRKLNLLHDNFNESNKRLEELEKENTDLRENKNLQDEQLNELTSVKDGVTDLQKENKRLENELQDLKASYLLQKEEVNKMAEESVKLADRLATTIAENAALLEDNGRLLQASKHEEQKAADELKELKSEHGWMREQLEAAVEQKERLQEILSSQKMEHEAETLELANVNSDLRKANEDLKSSSSFMKERLKKLEAALEQKQRLQEILSAQKMEYETETRELAHANSDLQKANEELRSSSNFLEENLKEQLSKLSVENKNLHAMHEQLKLSIHLQEGKHTKEVEELSRTNQKLVQAREELRQSLEAEFAAQTAVREQAIARKQSQLRELAAKLCALESSCKDDQEALIESLHMSNAHISMLDDELGRTRHEREDLAVKVGVLAQQNQELVVSMKLERLHLAQELSNYLGALSFQQDSLSSICSNIGGIVRA